MWPPHKDWDREGVLKNLGESLWVLQIGTRPDKPTAGPTARNCIALFVFQLIDLIVF